MNRVEARNNMLWARLRSDIKFEIERLSEGGFDSTLIPGDINSADIQILKELGFSVMRISNDDGYYEFKIKWD